MISSLVASGLTQAQIGSRIGRPQSWVSAVLKGSISSVRWEDGEAIRCLCIERIGSVPVPSAESDVVSQV